MTLTHMEFLWLHAANVFLGVAVVVAFLGAILKELVGQHHHHHLHG